VWTHYLDLVHSREEADQFRRDNAQLRSAAARGERALERVARLEAVLGLRAQVPAETLAARVFARDLSELFRVLRVRLDRGGAEVRPGMPVIVPEGVVGRIDRTYGEWSDVLLTVDAKSKIDVRVEPSGARGIAQGMQGRNKYGCRLNYVVRDDVVRVGDRVVTSGQDGVFPKDLDVGRVSSVARREFGLYQDVEVTPAVEFDDLEEVLVVLAPPPSDDPEAKVRAREAARGLTVHQ
jgi:rod shape-determining protein MreC